MIRPRGKASRIFKKIISLEDNMPKKPSTKSRKKESKGMEKAIKRRSYAVVKTMDKGTRKKK